MRDPNEISLATPHGRAPQQQPPGAAKLREPDGFRRPHPLVRIDTLIGGSGAALTEGWADFAFNARELLPKEERPFRLRYGHEPFRVAVAGGSYDILALSDAIAFLVRRRNPTTSLSLAQLDAINGRSPRRGLPRIETWDQLGLEGEWAGWPIKLYGVRPENGFVGAQLGGCRCIKGDLRKLGYQRGTVEKPASLNEALGRPG